jgi:acetyltransferase-like isoleucine patch superfamily enzyme
MRNAAFLTRDELESLGWAGLGRDVLVHSTCVLVGCKNITIGDNVRIDPFCILTASEPMEIGSHVHIAGNVTLAGGHGVTIGDFCGVSMGTRVLSSTDDFRAGALMGPTIPMDLRAPISGRVHFGKYSCVGANSIVLPAACLGEGATVGALSLVRGEIEPWTLNGGVPAKKIGARDREGVLRAAEAFLARRVENGD